MPTDVVLPQGGLEVTEGTVLAIDVIVGARVAAGDRLAEVETDKAVAEVTAPRDGVVTAIEVEVGDTVPVGAVLIRLGDSEGDVPAHQEEAVAAERIVEQEPALAGVGASGNGRGAHRILAAPVARRAALHLNVVLEEVKGTGPRGRITLRDVERVAEERGDEPGERLEPMSATRRAIARRMSQSQLVPRFTLHRDVDFTWLLAEKSRIAGASVNDLLIQALALAVTKHPDLAAQYVEGDRPQLRRRDGVDVGLAVATDRGLIVPVIRRAHERTLSEIATERKRLTHAGRDGRLPIDEMQGATISMSSLAAFGVDRFDAMLNPPEAAILAVGRTTDRVVPTARGIEVAPIATLTMTFDHRVVDGATGARALRELAELLEGDAAWRE